MTLTNLTQGSYHLSIGEYGVLMLTPLSECNQESFVPSSQQPNNRQFPIVRQPSARLYTSALGLAGGVGLLVSCIWSVLLPAIGSIGVIGIAYLVNRKITPLHAKELSSEAIKSQNLFVQQIGSKTGSLLDESVNTNNLPILPMSNVAKQPNIPPPPMPGSEGNATSQSNSPLPSSAREEKSSGKPSTSGAPKPEDTKTQLLDSIKNSFNSIRVKELLKENPEKYPSNLLLKELKTTYVRALAIGESKILGKTYFKDKIDNFEKNFDIVEQEENQTAKEMEDICKKTSDFNSLLKNMQWAKSLLEVLSGREDLSDKTREHCSKKLKSIDEHIDKLQRRNRKEPEEASGSNTQDISSSHDVASILARRVAIEYSDSSSSSEGETEDEDEWKSEVL